MILISLNVYTVYSRMKTVKWLVNEMLKLPSITSEHISNFQMELSYHLETHTDSLDDCIYGFEQYSRHNWVKFETDNIVLYIINKDILKHSDPKLTLQLHHIGGMYRIGKKQTGVNLITGECWLCKMI